MSNRTRTVAVAIFSIAVLTAVGCNSEGTEKPAEAAAATAPEKKAPTGPIEVAVSDANKAAVSTVLMAADALDGAKDGVIGKCPGCALMMEGKADHAMKVADHELHFCSDTCRDRFAENAEASLVALELPQH